MWKKIISFMTSLPFYLSNAIVALLALNAYKNNSLTDLITLGVALLGIIGALSGLCYAGSTTSRKSETTSKVFWICGDRFLHSFIAIVFGFLFLGVSIYINQNGLWGWKNKIILTVASSLFSIFSFFNLFWAARSFSIGFHMIRNTLNEQFPLRDERLFDDLNKETSVEKH